VKHVDIPEASSRRLQSGSLSPFQKEFQVSVENPAQVKDLEVKKQEGVEVSARVKDPAGVKDGEGVCPYPVKKLIAKNVKSEMKNAQICTDKSVGVSTEISSEATNSSSNLNKSDILENDKCTEVYNEKESSTDTNTYASGNTVSEVSLLLTMRTPLTPIHTGSR
jgi:hypothetical protein